MSLNSTANKLARTKQLAGNFEAQVAIVSLATTDRRGAVKFDGDDLPTSLANLLASAGASAAIAAAVAAAGLGTSYNVAAAGTVYTLTATSALAAFGTTSPTLTLAVAGKYLISGIAVLNNVGATYASSRTVNLKLRRTNNTAADLTNGGTSFETGITSTVTGPMGTRALPPTIYQASAGDVISLFASVSVIASAGSSTVDAVILTAVKIG